MTNANAQERRRFARSDTDVFLRYRVISVKDLPAENEPLNTGSAGRLRLLTTFAEMTKRHAPVLHTIREGMPEVAECLQLLDRKIDLIARSLVLWDIDTQEAPLSRVNLSAGGIGFYGATPLPAGTALEIELVLFPRFISILAYGKVVYHRHEPGERMPYYMGVAFIRIRDDDRTRLAQHVLGREAGPPKPGGSTEPGP